MSNSEEIPVEETVPPEDTPAEDTPTEDKPTDDTPAEVIVDIPREVLGVISKFISHMNPENQLLLANVLQKLPYATLLLISEFKPKSTMKIIDCFEDKIMNTGRTRYACWTKIQLVPSSLRNVNWADIMGTITDQLDHYVCWAIVTVDLIRAIRLIEGREEDPNIRYSAQDLIDFENPSQRAKMSRTEHYCYTSNIIKGMKYVMANGVEKEEDRPFRGCPPDIPNRVSPQFGCIKDYKKLRTIDEMLLQLRHHPIGAAVAMFRPDYHQIGNKMYRGPELHNSKLVGLHAVSLIAAGEENGEKYVVAKSSHGAGFGNNGYLKISLEVMVLYVPIPDEDINVKADKYFGKPNSLVRLFSYPILFSQEEEENHKKMHRV